MSEQKELTIKETMEALVAVEKLAVAGAKVYADQKISTSDLSVLIDLAKESDKILEGIKDIDKIDDEIKDLDQEEAIAIVLKVMAMLKAVKNAK